MTEKTPAQILWEAADIVDEGWCQGAYHDAGSYCALGAIAKAQGWNEDLAVVAVFEFTPAARQFSQRLVWGVPAWNDTPGRTATEVSLTMRAVALELDPSLANIGETTHEFEIVPMTAPATQPVEQPTPDVAPVEEPDRELQPA